MAEAILSPTVCDITFPRGSTINLTVTIKDRATPAVVVDITNDEVQLLVKYGNNEVLLDINGVGDHDDPTNGVTKFILLPAVTAGLNTNDKQLVKWSYSVMWKSAAGLEDTPIVGIMTVTPYAYKAIP